MVVSNLSFGIYCFVFLHMCVHACKSEGNLMGLSSDTAYLSFERGSLTGLGFKEQARLATPRHLYLLLSPALRLQAHPHSPPGLLLLLLYVFLFVSSEDLNSGFHACKANTLLAEPSL